MNGKFSNGKGYSGMPQTKYNAPKAVDHAQIMSSPKTITLFDKIIPGREFESLLAAFKPGSAVNIDIATEIRRAISEVEKIRGRPLICYVANVVSSKIKAPTGIDNNDDLPFAEMISMIPAEIREVDILLVTPGGSGEQIGKFVNKLRPRFDYVGFILPNMAMSAGTIFVTSGDEIIMDSRAYIGPIDPQVPNREGRFIPAQSILTLIKDIQDRGQEKIDKGKNPDWTDMQILNRIDARDIGSAKNGSQYSIELVTKYLIDYKFKSWTNHSTTGLPVTPIEKQAKAKEIANLLCDHGEWKTHSRGITRESAWTDCKLKITNLE
uniref:SDH family Clp fold serine proteinase n=1 Tax=Mucilaginibacter sp. TaxID=1882438 RepID=UPI0025F4A165